MRPFGIGQAFLYLGHNVRRQIGRQVGQFVGVQVFGSSQQIGPIHGCNQRLPDPVIYFQQDVAVVFGIDQTPDKLALFGRQRLQNERDICRVQRIQGIAQFGFMLRRIRPSTSVD